MKDNKKYIILFVVLFILILGLGGYKLYYKVISKAECKTCLECKKCLINEETKILIKIEKDEIHEPLNITSVEIRENKDAYLNLSNDLANEYGKNYKILTNVTSAYVMNFANGGYRSIIFLKENGNLTAISAQGLIDGEIKFITNFGNIKNIVSIIQTFEPGDETGEGSYWSVTALDINGNKYLLDSYLE